MSDLSTTRAVQEARETHRGVLSGDACTQFECSGRIIVSNVLRVNGWVIRYHACSRCGHRPPNNKWTNRS